MCPYERLDVDLEKARNKYGPQVGCVVVTSTTDDGKNDKDGLVNKNDDDCPPTKSDLEHLSSGQGDQFRCIFWTDARAAAVERVRQLLLDDYEQMQMQYNDHDDHYGDGGENVEATNEVETFQRQPGNYFAYCVADAYHAQFQPLLSQAVQDQRHDETLNLLFAVTYWLCATTTPRG
jgi:hypothetical protein